MKIKKTAHRLKFYLHHGSIALLPHGLFSPWRENILQSLKNYPLKEQTAILKRVGHLNQLTKPFSLPVEKTTTLKKLHLRGHNSSYFLDFVRVMKYFSPHLPFCYQFGDVVTVPDSPTFVKSRPISLTKPPINENSVLLKLDSVRHFYIPPDRFPYQEKKPLLVWRGAAHQQHRIEFLEKFHHSPLCDVGCVHEKSKNMPYHRTFLSLDEQRQYKFILSLEGNDVATNLKWILASNSLCFMRRPHFETWFCEGLLIPNYHYVLLEDDFSDLSEKLAFYQQNSAAAEKIIAQANDYVRQFFDAKKERLISLLVIERYFSLLQNQL